MPKQTPDLKRSDPARPDRARMSARKEAGLRVEELKLKLQLLTDKYFDQSLRIIKRWVSEAGKDNKRG